MPVNEGRLTFGARARNLGFRQLSTAWPKSRKAPVATTAATSVTKGWSSRLPALKALLMSCQLGQDSRLRRQKPVGPDCEVVAEPVDVDGPAAVFLLPHRQADGDLGSGVEAAVRAGVLAPGFGSGGLLEIGHGACTST